MKADEDEDIVLDKGDSGTNADVDIVDEVVLVVVRRKDMVMTNSMLMRNRRN